MECERTILRRAFTKDLRRDRTGTGMRMREFMKNRMCVFILLLVLLLPCVRITAGYSEAAFSDDPDAVERAADSVFMLEVYSYNNQQVAVGSGVSTSASISRVAKDLKPSRFDIVFLLPLEGDLCGGGHPTALRLYMK